MSFDITTIDKNFKIETNIEREALRFFDVKDAPLNLYGVWHDGEAYRRVPRDVAKATSPELITSSIKTAGGRIRFVTDSPYVVIKAFYPFITVFGHMTRAGTSGFDLYVNEGGREVYKKSMFPPSNTDTSFDAVFDFPDVKERLITINFPLYNPVNELYLGLHSKASLKPAPDYSVKLPIVSYGSSITQGGCASRPGNSYQAMLSRRYDADFINLGFSGVARGEAAIRDYIASLPMSAFIFDYDYNAPTPEHLKETHKPFYEAVRKARPDAPILMMGHPEFYSNEMLVKRNAVVKETFDYAVANGDKNVYYIHSNELFELCEDGGTVDGVHPTDFGFRSMAKAMAKIFDKIFQVKSDQF